MDHSLLFALYIYDVMSEGAPSKEVQRKPEKIRATPLALRSRLEARVLSQKVYFFCLLNVP
jgi:hypothetical protein